MGNHKFTYVGTRGYPYGHVWDCTDGSDVSLQNSSVCPHIVGIASISFTRYFENNIVRTSGIAFNHTGLVTKTTSILVLFVELIMELRYITALPK